MISISESGLQAAIEAVQKLPSTAGFQSAFEAAGRRLSAIVRERTPPGYSKKLPQSVEYQASETGFVVGYEQGVETAGNTKYDSVTRPKTRGKTVVARKVWAKPAELEDVLEETADEYLDEVLSVIERGVSSGIS